MTELLACPGCGKSVDSDWRFCVECGAEREGIYDAPEPAPSTDEESTGLPGGSDVKWRGLESLAVFVISLFVAVLFTGIAAMFVGTDPSKGEKDIVMVSALIGNQLGLIGVTLGWLKFRHQVGLKALGLGSFQRSYLGVGVGAGALGVVLSATVAVIIVKIVEIIQGNPPADPQQIELQTDPSGLLLMLLAASTIVLAPLSEEMFFRGMLHQGVRRWLRLGPGLILSSAVFAGTHVIPLVIPSIFVLALVLGTVYERSKSLWVPIIAHAAFNVVGYWATFVA